MKMPKHLKSATALIALTAMASPMAAISAPPPNSPWNLETTFTPGGTVTAAMPWQSRYATGANCEIDQGPLSVPWSRDAGKLQGRNAPTVDASGGASNPVVFRNVSTSNSAPAGWALSFGAGQVGLTTSATRCGVVRFVAPADGIYQVSGEFFSPQNLPGSPHPNPATNKVMAFVRSGTQQNSGLVDKPASIQSWTIPASPTYPLQAGQFIDFAVKDAGNGFANDVALLSARVTWVDNLPTGFKASKFDFEGGQGCAIEQGTDTPYCWGVNNWYQLGTITPPSSNKAVVAQRIVNHMASTGGGIVKNLQVGANNVCYLTTTGQVLCLGANTMLQSGAATGSLINSSNGGTHAVYDMTAQLPANPRVKIDGFTGCLINPASNVQCWGGNIINTSSFGGILGWKNGSVFTPSNMPLQDVPNIAGASQVAPGGTMTCAIVSATARVACWGNTPWGASMLGGGPSPTMLTPLHPDGIAQTFVLTAPSTPLLQVQKIEVSGVRACALKAGGSLWCWGMNHTYGELLGAPMASQTPIPPGIVNMAMALPAPFNSGVTDFALSSNGLCAVKGGQVYCLGRNVAGQLGKPPQSPVEWRTPFAAYSGQTNVVVDVTSIPGLTGVSKIKGGDRSFCALNASGEIWCWGANNDGQLGAGLTTGTSAMSATPVRVIK